MRSNADKLSKNQKVLIRWWWLNSVCARSTLFAERPNNFLLKTQRFLAEEFVDFCCRTTGPEIMQRRTICACVQNEGANEKDHYRKMPHLRECDRSLHPKTIADYPQLSLWRSTWRSFLSMTTATKNCSFARLHLTLARVTNIIWHGPVLSLIPK